MEIIYKTDIIPTAEQVIELYENCGLLRPTKDNLCAFTFGTNGYGICTIP